ncbi:MAG: hypothetical protein EHM63_08285, partial [Actinobacteria bacterium]
GAAGSAGAMIDLSTAEQISRGFVGKSKHNLIWKAAPGYMGKDKAKLLLNLFASAITALPRGGDIEVQMAGTLENPSFLIRCHGTNARAPLHLAEFIAGEHAPPLDAMTIQAYYTWRLASTAGMRLAVLRETRMPAVHCAIGPPRSAVTHLPDLALAVGRGITRWCQEPIPAT